MKGNQFLRPLAARTAARQGICQCTSKPSFLHDLQPRTIRRPLSSTPRRRIQQPGDSPNFTSIVDNPPELVRTGRKHGPGLILLAIIPITAFALGTWQVYRLQWKTELIAKSEDRIVRAPLPLPPRVDPAAIADFDYRRVYSTGRYRHSHEMLIGPRIRDGESGYMVVTPFEPAIDMEGDGSRARPVLVNRGWIAKKFREPRTRPESVVEGEVRVEGLLRKPLQKNMFTPDNRPDIKEFYFPDVEEMARLTGSQPVWVEQTMAPDFHTLLDMEARGIPIGKPAEVGLRNSHVQYIFTWYGLAIATSIMFWMVVKKPPSDVAKRVRQNRSW